MPTSRPRHTITETDELARALDDAAARWPEERGRAGLLLRLAREGHRSIDRERENASADRRAAVHRTRGALTGAYPDGYLARLREEWPA
jgi:hypothetical protein